MRRRLPAGAPADRPTWPGRWSELAYAEVGPDAEQVAAVEHDRAAVAAEIRRRQAWTPRVARWFDVRRLLAPPRPRRAAAHPAGRRARRLVGRPAPSRAAPPADGRGHSPSGPASSSSRRKRSRMRRPAPPRTSRRPLARTDCGELLEARPGRACAGCARTRAREPSMTQEAGERQPERCRQRERRGTTTPTTNPTTAHFMRRTVCRYSVVSLTSRANVGSSS